MAAIPTGVCRGVVALALLFAVGGCGEDEPTVEPGACVSVGEDKSVQAVDCDDPSAEVMLVKSFGPLGGECVSPERIVDGRRLGPPSVWCVVDPDSVGPAQQSRINEEKKEYGN